MFYSACRDGCCVCCCQNLKPCMPGSKGAISRSLENGFERFSWATCGSSCFSWGCLLAVTWLTNVFLLYIRGLSSRLPLAFRGFTLAKVVSGFTIDGGHVVLHGFHGLVYIQPWLTKVLFVMYYRCGFHIIIVLP